MKVSEITVANVATYLRLEVSTDPILPPILISAVKFIENETGIHDEEVTDEYEANGIGDDFKLSKNPIVSGTAVVKLDDVTLEEDTDYTINEIKGIVTFESVPEDGSVVEISYDYGLDAFEEFYIVVMVLCQDMYDNRTLYVDKTNLNSVVSSILDMHRTNLLPTSEV